MKFCTNCGAKIEEGSKYCTTCGKDLSNEIVKEEKKEEKVDTTHYTKIDPNTVPIEEKGW
ncbi:MAG: zinc-ribbon domain-containing protein [Bacilli bacterium]|nr:zinc-ribbon domain-containing protein [Bacilli bacterium]